MPQIKFYQHNCFGSLDYLDATAELDSYLAMQHRAHASGPTTQVSGWHSPDKSVAAVLLTPWCPGHPFPR